jgi:arylsulfatase A-like enzyme
VRDNTTILFVGDNGTPAEVVAPPYDQGHAKSTVYEGGVRVPLVVAGHGVTRRGEREDSLVNGTDLFATIARLGGHPDTAINDGISFDAALTDPDFAGRTHLYTEYPGVWAVRDARYKLIQHDSGERQLFDLQTDPLETQDLLASSPSPDVLAVADGLEAYQQDLQAAP